MKAILGIDVAGAYKPALRLLERLKIQFDEILLVSALERDVAVERERTEAVLSEVAKRVEENGVRCRSEVVPGRAAEVLIELGERESADLIAVQSERKGAFRSFFFGSVSRGLTIGANRSLLISKDHSVPDGAIGAVFATDHSSYSQLVADEFIRLAPKGIGKLHIVSAVSMQDYSFWAEHFDPYRSTEEREKALQKEFRDRNAALAERFLKEGYQATYESPIGSANEAIVQAMESQGAELLIIGAQGHGFVERMLIGSVSLHQVVIEPHSVLLIRPRAT